MIRRWGAIAAAVVLLGFGLSRAEAGTMPTATLYVDDDGQAGSGGCASGMAFTSIQAAVNAASPGSTILVCPGTYPETVTVPANKPGLIIVGSRGSGNGGGESETPDPGQGQDPAMGGGNVSIPDGAPRIDRSGLNPNGGTPSGLERCGETRAPRPARDSVVTAVNAAGGIINLLANNTTFQGFVVQGNTAGVGIYTAPTASGHQVQLNIVQNNVFGIYFNASGTTLSRVRSNCLRNNNVTGAANGNGLYSDQGLRSARVNNNITVNQQNAGFLVTEFGGSVVSDLIFQENLSLTDAAGFIIAEGTTDVRVLRNFVERTSFGTAIVVYASNTNLRIAGNTLSRPASRGIQINSSFGSGVTNSSFLIESNEIRNAGRANGGEFGDGIRIAPNSLTNSLIQNNTIRSSSDDGIQINAGGNGGNTIRNNSIQTSVRHDCHDATTGSGSGGSANTWTGNTGATQNRAGLCPGAAVTPPFDHD